MQYFHFCKKGQVIPFFTLFLILAGLIYKPSLEAAEAGTVTNVDKKIEYPKGALQQAIDDADSGNTLILHGPYTYEHGTPRDKTSFTIENKSLTIKGKGEVVLDGQKTRRVMSIHSKEKDIQVNLKNLIIRKGNAFVGAGIDAFDQVKLNLEEVVFVKNRAENRGGGLLFQGINLEIRDCEFLNNHAESGGGIWMETSSGNVIRIPNNQIIKTKFEGNTCTFNGAGLLVTGEKDENNETELTLCKILNNKADHFGGGIYDAAFVSILTRTIIEENKAEKGGGVYKAKQAVFNISFSSKVINNKPDDIFP